MQLPEKAQQAIDQLGEDAVVFRRTRGTSSYCVVNRPATAAEYRMFRVATESIQHSNGRKNSLTPIENLVRATLVYPDQSGLDAVVEAFPGVLDMQANSLIDRATGVEGN